MFPLACGILVGMKRISALFTDHPASVNETYFQHMRMSAGFGWHLLRAAGACFVHALLPFLFTTTGSGIIRDLHARMVAHRTVRPAVAEAPYYSGSQAVRE